MDRAEYIRRLKNKLHSVPEAEAQDAIQYYEEYFDEAGAENEQSSIEELGTPEKAASNIRAQYAIKDMERSDGSAKKGFKTVFVVLLAVFASPIALPIAIALFAVILAVIIALISVLISLFAAAVAAGIGGLGIVVAGFAILIQSPATFLFFLGMGLCSAAIGVSMFIGILYISRKCFTGLASLLNKKFLRRKEK